MAIKTTRGDGDSRHLIRGVHASIRAKTEPPRRQSETNAAPIKRLRMPHVKRSRSSMVGLFPLRAKAVISNGPVMTLFDLDSRIKSGRWAMATNATAQATAMLLSMTIRIVRTHLRSVDG